MCLPKGQRNSHPHRQHSCAHTSAQQTTAEMWREFSQELLAVGVIASGVFIILGALLYYYFTQNFGVHVEQSFWFTRLFVLAARWLPVICLALAGYKVVVKGLQRVDVLERESKSKSRVQVRS